MYFWCATEFYNVYVCHDMKMVENRWVRMIKTRKDSAVKDVACAHGGPDPSLVRTPLILREPGRGRTWGPDGTRATC